jgi:uncharacterized membrane protein (DUF106 family)
MNSEGKEGGFIGIFIVMFASLAIAFFWDKVGFIKNGAHAVLNPTAGFLLNWNITIGMSLIILVISIFMTLIQKYATDQKTLKEMREEQKILQEEMKKYKNHPEKVAELSRKQLEFIPKTMKLTMRPIVYTAIPLILFFRWFNDFFAPMVGFKFFGFFSWFWFYLLGTLIFSSILRKIFKVV